MNEWYLWFDNGIGMVCYGYGNYDCREEVKIEIGRVRIDQVRELLNRPT